MVRINHRAADWQSRVDTGRSGVDTSMYVKCAVPRCASTASADAAFAPRSLVSPRRISPPPMRSSASPTAADVDRGDRLRERGGKLRDDARRVGRRQQIARRRRLAHAAHLDAVRRDHARVRDHVTVRGDEHHAVRDLDVRGRRVLRDRDLHRAREVARHRSRARPTAAVRSGGRPRPASTNKRWSCTCTADAARTCASVTCCAPDNADVIDVEHR